MNPFEGRAASQLTPADLESLADDQVAESRFVEYKSKLPGPTDDNKREFLADISAFANAVGGWVFYGIEESQGLPTSIPGLPGANLDAEILRLEQMLSRGVEPRIPGISMAPVPMANGERVLSVRILRSWAGPHMVTFGGSSRFFSRNNGGKYQLDVHELRQAFGAAEAATARLKAFRTERLGRIVADETPVPLARRARVVLHVLPVAVPRSLAAADLQALKSAWDALAPLGEMFAGRFEFNFDGALVTQAQAPAEPRQNYLQIFRDGSLESASIEVFYELGDGRKVLGGQAFENQVRSAVRRFMALAGRLSIEPPFVVGLSLFGVLGYRLHGGESLAPIGHLTDPFDRDNLVLPEIWVESATSNVSELLADSFDVIWNAAGQPSSPFR